MSRDRSPVAWNDHKLRYVAERVAGKKVLDLGCVQHDPENYKSPYWLHRLVCHKSPSVLGLDYLEEGVAKLSELGYNVVHGDATNFELHETFDVVIAGDLIEHLGNMDGFLNSVKNHLNHDGILIVSTPNPWYWRNIVKSIFSYEVNNNPEHTCWFCPRTFRQLANRHGLDIAQIEFGSTYARDRFMPLPRGIRHTSWHATVSIKS